ncbi:hypothetical protein CRYUN_Cryun18bG0099500 [Craigia yunnanensis]
MMGGGSVYWGRKEESKEVKGIVVIFAWVSIHEKNLQNYLDLYSSLGWNSLISRADFLNSYCPERAMSLAFVLLNELLEELKIRTCPVVFVAFSGSPKACLYKVFQIIQGTGEDQLNLDGSQLIRNRVCGQIYDSSPVDFASDLNAQFSLHPSLRKMPGSSKLVSWIAKGVASGLDGLYLTGFETQRTEYWQTLYSTVDLDAPYLLLCSENDELASYPVIINFAQCLQDLGADIKVVKWNGSPHLEHYKHYPIQYRAAVASFLEKANSVYFHRIQRLGERNGVHDAISELICGLQKAAVNSNQSLRRVALGPSDHFFLPSSAEYHNNRESGSLQDEQRERQFSLPVPRSINAHSVLGQILFDACVPKNIEGWDIRFSGSVKGQPFASARSQMVLDINNERLVDQYDNDCKNPSSGIFYGIRYLASIIDFKEIKSIDNHSFFILVNGSRIDSELIELETIKACKLSTSQADYMLWDKTLKGFELLVTNVGFLRARLKRLMTLALELQEAAESERCRVKRGRPPKCKLFRKKLSGLDEMTVNQLVSHEKDKAQGSSQALMLEAFAKGRQDGRFGRRTRERVSNKIFSGKGKEHKICEKTRDKPLENYGMYENRISVENTGKFLEEVLPLDISQTDIHLMISGEKENWSCEESTDRTLKEVLSLDISEKSIQKNDPTVYSSNLGPTAYQSENDSVVLGSEVLDRIRLSESIVDFKEVKNFEDFSILVNGLIIDSDLSKYLQTKYYELCSSQKSFLHENHLEGLNCKLVAGVIAETINIADAIRAAKLTTSHHSFLT